MHRTTSVQIIALLALALIMPVIALKPTQPTTASAGSPIAPTKLSTKPLESLLNADGTLNLQSGYAGSLDPKGWRMVSKQGEKPRFMRDADVPTLAEDPNWDRKFAAPGLSDYPYAIAVSGTDVYVGGNFDAAEGVRANNIARWDSTTGRWHTLGSGPNNGVSGSAYASVFAVEVIGDNVFVGGYFTSAGGVLVNNIAQWNTATQRWDALGDGLNGDVATLAVSGADLYVGGSFTSAGGVSAEKIARWNMATQQWFPLDSGLRGPYSRVEDLAIMASDVYAGGGFTTAGGTAANNIARWSITSQQWYPLGSGADNYVHALASVGTDLYMGGSFDTAGDINVQHIARLDTITGAWYSLQHGGTEDTVRSLATIGSDLYIGGYFANAGDVAATYIARFDTTDGSWHTLGDGAAEGVGLYNDSGVYSIGTGPAGVFAGGDFDRAGRIRVERLEQ
jgi:trimeric autotransporter adhesin